MPVHLKIRSFFLFSALLLSAGIHSQIKKMDVNGSVLDSRTSRPIPHCFVDVQLGDTIIRQKVDTGGKFFVSFSSELLKKGTIIINAWQDRTDIIAERKSAGGCKEITNYGGYLQNSGKVDIIDSTLTSYTFDMTLAPTESGLIFPFFIFEKNSLKMLVLDKKFSDTSLICLKEALDINPGCSSADVKSFISR